MIISDLFYEYLAENGNLKIEGFGIFDSDINEPYIHPIDNEISPSTLNLKFRLDKNTIDDGFKSFAASKLNESESAVGQLIKSEKEGWINSLRKGIEVEFLYLGVLKLNSKGSVIFVQRNDFSLSKTHFGLASFQLNPINPVVVGHTSHASIVQPVSKNKSIIGIWIAAASIVLLLAAGYWFFGDKLLNFNQNPEIPKSVEVQKPIIEVDTIQMDTIPEATADTLNLDSNRIADEQVIEEQKVNSSVQSSQISNSDLPYLVVAGCFLNDNIANEYLNSLKSKGYDAVIEGKTSNGLTRVCSGKYKTMQEAANASKEFNKNENKSSWVQKVEL